MAGLRGFNLLQGKRAQLVPITSSVIIVLAAKEENQTARVCAFTLRRYNEGLQLSNTIRMCDAFSFLNKYYEDERRKKTSPDDDLVINITPTERFLFNLFKGIGVFTVVFIISSMSSSLMNSHCNSFVNTLQKTKRS